MGQSKLRKDAFISGPGYSGRESMAWVMWYPFEFSLGDGAAHI